MRKCSCGDGISIQHREEREGENERKAIRGNCFVSAFKCQSCVWHGKFAKSSINYLQVMLKFKRLIAFGAFEFPQER